MNLPYCLALLNNIITQFIEQDKDFFKDKKDEFFEAFSTHFKDLTYNCLLILKQADPPQDEGVPVYVNQSNQRLRKVGIHRIRAIEQLKTLFTALGKRGSIKDSPILGEILRRKVIETMLYMIRTYPFCSMSHQQAIQILNSLKEAFDVEDLATLKNFVKIELGGDTGFNFPSGFKTAGMNMGQIIQIAFELRNITQQALDDMSSDDEEAQEDEEAASRRIEMSDWFRFCKEKVDKIEKVWNKKLEDPDDPNGSDDEKSDDNADKIGVQDEKDQYEQ